jgi:hypothetical protein
MEDCINGAVSLRQSKVQEFKVNFRLAALKTTLSRKAKDRSNRSTGLLRSNRSSRSTPFASFKALAVPSSKVQEFKVTLAVQAVPTVQPLRSVQNVDEDDRA